LEHRSEEAENQPPINRYPPIRSPPAVPAEPSTPSPPPTPAWRAQISERKKTRAYVPVLRPEAPLRLGDTPQWKRELAEKRKSRRGGSVDGGVEGMSGGGPGGTEGGEGAGAGAAEAGETLPPWKQELELRKKRGSLGASRGKTGE
jgi:hypothetical protein